MSLHGQSAVVDRLAVLFMWVTALLVTAPSRALICWDMERRLLRWVADSGGPIACFGTCITGTPLLYEIVLAPMIPAYCWIQSIPSRLVDAAAAVCCTPQPAGQPYNSCPAEPIPDCLPALALKAEHCHLVQGVDSTVSAPTEVHSSCSMCPVRRDHHCCCCVGVSLSTGVSWLLVAIASLLSWSAPSCSPACPWRRAWSHWQEHYSTSCWACKQQQQSMAPGCC